MSFDTPLNDAGGLASEASTAARTASSGNNSTSSPVDVAGLDQRPNREYPVTAMAMMSESDAADSSSRSLRFRKVFSRPRNNDVSGSKRGSFVSSLRSSIRSSFNLSDDDSLEAEHHGSDDLTPPGQKPPSSGRRRLSLLKNSFSTSRRSSAFSSRSSIGSSGTGSRSRSRRSSTVNRKSSLDLIRGSGGEYRPRAEHPLLTDNPPSEDKAQRRGSFLGAAMRKLSMSGSPNNASGGAKINRTKSTGALKSMSTSAASPLSASDHPRQRKNSMFGSFRRGSSARHIASRDEDPTLGLFTSNHL